MVVFLLLRGVRGVAGVPIVSNFIMLNWVSFTQNFTVFCRSLVQHCELVCEQRGTPYLNHREAMHQQYSGIHFIRTLSVASCRRSILKIAKDTRHVIQRMMTQRHLTSLTSDEIVSIGDRIQGHFGLRLQQGEAKCAGAYNAMDITRCLMTVSEGVFQCSPVAYDDTIHDWFVSRQSNKKTAATTLLSFGAETCEGMKAAVIRMRDCIEPLSVNMSTMYVLYCETRQSMNKYGRGILCFLIEQYVKRKDVRAVVSASNSRLQASDEVSECHCIQTLECIRKSLRCYLCSILC
jgi:hypothetical protein